MATAQLATQRLVENAWLLSGRGTPPGDILGGATWGPAQRTCIDADSRVLLAIGAVGGRALRVHVRTDTTDHCAVWAQRSADPTAAATTRLFDGTDTTAYDAICAAAREAGLIDAFRVDHAVLGVAGRLFRLTEAPGRLLVGWHLDRHADPRRLLARLGLGDAVDPALAWLSALLGWPGAGRSGPWSITRDLRDSRCAWLGTTAWARQLEDDAKRRRLVEALTCLGGDGAYAEAVYKLVAASHGSTSRPRIGRAVEVALSPAAVTDAEVHLGLPSSSPRRLARLDLNQEHAR